MQPMRIAAVAATSLVGLLLLLCIPGPRPALAPAPPRGGAFTWNQDAYWQALQQDYVDARAAGCPTAEPRAARALAALDAEVARLSADSVPPEAPVLDSLERHYFALGPLIAACPQQMEDYVRLSGRLREAIKWQSRHWDVTAVAGRVRLYRMLYGVRGAVEEVTLHHPDRAIALIPGIQEPSVTPGTTVQGVEIHSGDILVSRGGYPTSALIARGNDYPGNFSHVGLVYVDSATHEASVIEAHIERGVAVSTAAAYLRDKKLRIMVLRLRSDLPIMVADPWLPHRAAALSFARAQAGHIAYDFDMDYTDPSKLFCSEVASSVYRDVGVTLWTGLSTISAPGLRRWLADFGVRHFETQEPSDLEYDPQLVVVAEWRDPAMLLHDHIDNAVIDAMLEGANRGAAIDYPWYQLSLIRLAKAYSWVVERFGATGPVPEGMSALAALRNKSFSAHERRLAARVTEAAMRLAQQRGFPPPYWELLDLARAEAARRL